MKIRLIAAAVVLASYGHGVLADGQVAAGKATFERVCAKCHYEDDFAGKSSQDILELIKQMAAPGSGHKFDLAGLGEGELEELAAFLASVY